MSDLRFQQFRQIVNVFNVIVFFAQLAVRNRNQFRIFTGFVGHFQNANRTATDHRTGCSGYGVGTSTSTGSPSRDRVWLM
ncbi:hypothetical protein EN35_08590 [Rhodococcus qingshengii]|nr:hypothetical protein EN35_08590 [Rhodococcus qingshengii]